MPDLNKLQVLASVGYRVQACCGICKYGNFAPGSPFGSCKAFRYEHAKHGDRPLSVHFAGVCRLQTQGFEPSEKRVQTIARSGFDRFQNFTVVEPCPDGSSCTATRPCCPHRNRPGYRHPCSGCNGGEGIKD